MLVFAVRNLTKKQFYGLNKPGRCTMRIHKSILVAIIGGFIGAMINYKWLGIKFTNFNDSNQYFIALSINMLYSFLVGYIYAVCRFYKHLSKKI